MTETFIKKTPFKRRFNLPPGSNLAPKVAKKQTLDLDKDKELEPHIQDADIKVELNSESLELASRDGHGTQMDEINDINDNNENKSSDFGTEGEFEGFNQNEDEIVLDDPIGNSNFYFQIFKLQCWQKISNFYFGEIAR